MAVHRPHHEHHGQRLAGALGMPDDAAAFPWSFTVQQPLHGFLDGAELLIAPNDLDGFALVVDREEREVADNLQQVHWVEHSSHQPLLIVGGTAAMLQVF